MTMSLSAPLQRAIYQRLTTAPELALVADRIFDDAPHRSADAGGALYVTLGDEAVSPWNTATDTGAIHNAVIRVYATQRGFLPAKDIAATIAEVIAATPPVPERGVVITHEFVSAETQRQEQGALRRIDLVFRFVIEDAPAT